MTPVFRSCEIPISLAPANRPNGAAECSHGWSDAALCVTQPVDARFLFLSSAPKGQRKCGRRDELRRTTRMRTIPLPLQGRNDKRLNLSTGSGRRGDLHPWLHPNAP